MAVPTNLAEALALLTYSGGNQITGLDVREVITWLASGAFSTSEAYTPVLTLDRNAYQTATATLGKVFVSLASSGHLPGTTKYIIIPAGTVSDSIDLIAGSDLNTAGWDPFVPTNDYVIIVTALSATQFISSGKDLGLKDVAAPVISSVTVNFGANPDGLVVALDSEAFLPDFSAVSLAPTGGGWVGPARTLVGFESVSDDAMTWTATLSGPIDPADQFQLVLGAGRTWQDLNGNLVAAGSHNVVVTGAFTPGDLANINMWLKADVGNGGVTVNGDPVGSWTSSVGTIAAFTSAGGARPLYRPTGIGGKPGLELNGSTQYLASTSTAGDLVGVGTAFYLAVICDIAAITTDQPNSYLNGMIFGEDDGYFGLHLRDTGDLAQGYIFDGSVEQVEMTVGAQPTGPVLIEYWLDAAAIYISVNGAAATSEAVDAAIAVLTGILQIGRTGAGSAWFQGVVGEIIHCTSVPSGGQRSQLLSYAQTEYGVP